MDSSAVTPTSNVVVPSFVTPDFAWIGGHADSQGVIPVIFAIIFIWWTIFTLVAIYHWLRFGRMSWFAMPLIALHLFVSYWLLTYITAGLH